MIYIVGGLPGAGKTTYSKKLANEQRAAVFSTDVWMSDLFWMDQAPGEDPQWALERTDRVENRMIKTCIELDAIGVSAILDIGFVNLKWRQKTYNMLNKAGMPFEVHFLEVDRPTRWKRVQQRNREKSETYAFDVTEEMLDFMDSVYDPIEPNELDGKLIIIKN